MQNTYKKLYQHCYNYSKLFGHNILLIKVNGIKEHFVHKCRMQQSSIVAIPGIHYQQCMVMQFSMKTTEVSNVCSDS